MDVAGNFYNSASGEYLTFVPINQAAASYTANTIRQTQEIADTLFYGAAAADSAGNFYSTNAPSNKALSNTIYKIAGPSPTATITYAASNVAGVSSPSSITLDGAGNLWVGSYYNSVYQAAATTGTYASYAISELDSNFNALSPNGTGTCTSHGDSNCHTNGGFQKPFFASSFETAIDISGNLWVPNAPATTTNNARSNPVTLYAQDGSNYTAIFNVTEVIGTAVPVVPLTIGLRDNKLNTKP